MFGWVWDWFARRDSRREFLRLSQVPVRQLGEMVANAVRRNEWECFDAGAHLTVPTDSADELLTKINELLQALHQHDIATTGSSGRDAQMFQFYDNGLAGVADSLEERITR